MGNIGANIGGRIGAGPTAARWLLIAWTGLCSLLLAPPAHADREGSIDIRSAYTEATDGVLYLNGRVDLSLGEEAVDALQKGVTLNIGFQIEVTQRRRYIWDNTIASLRQRYQLTFHALTGRYVLANLNSGERESFSALENALLRLGEVQGLPVIDEALLESENRYDGNLRVQMDIREMSGPLR
ncbi:MAG: DUF4390 domain-containing protein, partial [Gammaproteobacteria bacterium]